MGAQSAMTMIGGVDENCPQPTTIEPCGIINLAVEGSVYSTGWRIDRRPEIDLLENIDQLGVWYGTWVFAVMRCLVLLICTQCRYVTLMLVIVSFDMSQLNS